MLLEIAIEQLALIDSARISFGRGLSVLTGETGAGKSIILDAVEVALGGRASTGMVRAGEKKAVVEAVFDLGQCPEKLKVLENMGIPVEEDRLLLVRREIARGRSTIRLNGRTATVGMLKEAAAGLVDLHGQHEHQSLLQVDKHLDLLDQYGGSLLQQEGKPLDMLDQYGGTPLLALRDQVAQSVRELNRVREELRSLVGDERQRARQEDLLRFQVEELTAAELQVGEEEELEAEREVLAHAGKLKLAAVSAYTSLYEGSGRQPSVVDLLGQIESDLEDVLEHDPSLSEPVDMIRSALVHVQEASHLLAAYRDRVEDNPDRLASIETRLDQLSSLKRKYGDSVEEMLRYLEDAQAELDRLTHSQELVEKLQAEEAKLGAGAQELASRLTEARRHAAGELSARVVQELEDLGMSNARFHVSVIPAGDSYHSITARGWDRVEFLFSPNPGEPLKPLAKIVSGGEMSRIMLALKVILARVDGVPTLVFDEVDTGISGRAAQAVAEKLARIAGDRQVLCVTHLPQVAAMADSHLLISKEVREGRTYTGVCHLDEAGRAGELARMIGGAELSTLTMEAARDMLHRADELKADLRSA